MSGGNYNVSFRQVLESEHKLKVLSLIELYSEKAGHFKIKNLLCEDSINISECEVPAQYYNVFNTDDDVEITETLMSVLIYVAGYVAYKVSQNVSCQNCNLILYQNKALEFESPENIYQYLKLSDRGGLKWPQKFTIYIVIHSFQVFQKLISKTYEEDFLKIGKQKNILGQLILEKLELLNLFENKMCNCGTSSRLLGQKCISIISNIFLNNYCKVKNDNSKLLSNRRKLSVFTC